MKLERRINNVMKAMKRSKHYDMKVIWSNKLQELLKLKERKYERGGSGGGPARGSRGG